MADAQLFRLPNGDNILVYNDGRVVFDYQPFEGGHRDEADITNSALGRYLRWALLDDQTDPMPQGVPDGTTDGVPDGLPDPSDVLQTRVRPSGNRVRPTPSINVNVDGNVNGSNGNGNVEEQSHTKGLRQETKQTLLDSDIPSDVVDYLGKLPFCVNALNKSSNPVAAARTMQTKPGWEERFRRWQENHKKETVQ